MPLERSYLDHNATSPLRPEARDAMVEAMALVGNPSSVHAEGRDAKAMLERARRQVASLVGAKPEQVVFTSGGTEANAAVLARGSYDALALDLNSADSITGSHISGEAFFCAVSAIEHDSVRAGGRFRDEALLSLPVGEDGRVDTRVAADILTQVLGFGGSDPEPRLDSRFLVSLMQANNEVGTLQPVEEVAASVHALGGTFHTDAVQMAGKHAFAFSQSAADMATISAHKFGGPKGVGALLVKTPDRILDDALLIGGGQEKRMRAGTENLIGIVGFGAAAEAAVRDLDGFAALAEWRDALEAGIVKQTPDAIVIAETSPRIANTSCIALPGVAAETLVMALDLEGVAVSAGSACSSGKVTRSHVLEAMGLDDDISGSAIRVSLGWNSSKNHVDHFQRAWATVTDRLAKR